MNTTPAERSHPRELNDLRADESGLQEIGNRSQPHLCQECEPRRIRLVLRLSEPGACYHSHDEVPPYIRYQYMALYGFLHGYFSEVLGEQNGRSGDEPRQLIAAAWARICPAGVAAGKTGQWKFKTFFTASPAFLLASSSAAS